MSAVVEWLGRCRARSRLSVERIPWEECRAWRIEDERLVHESRGFFSIFAGRCRSGGPRGATVLQPMIDQPEIGILGFLLRTDRGRPELLVQAKTEPGTVGGTQLAPSVQATYSNYTRRHGGAPTPYLDRFTTPRPGSVLADALQSEHGWRFAGKLNRNMLVACAAGDVPEAGPAHRWCDAADVCRLIGEDFTVNTDARSVLVCGPWAELAADGEPFAAAARGGGFAQALRASWLADETIAEVPLEQAVARLERRRRAPGGAITPRPFFSLPGHVRVRDGLVRRPDAPRRGSEIRLVRVRAADREVAQWDQPLLADDGPQLVTLVAQRRRGTLHLLLRASVEPGLRNVAELGPTCEADGAGPLVPGALAEQIAAGDGLALRAASRQSDEGGRFDQVVAEYRVVEADEDARLPEDRDTVWLTLRQVQVLARRPGCLTNEARSVVSLLLRWV